MGDPSKDIRNKRKNRKRPKHSVTRRSTKEDVIYYSNKTNRLSNEVGKLGLTNKILRDILAADSISQVHYLLSNPIYLRLTHIHSLASLLNVSWITIISYIYLLKMSEQFKEPQDLDSWTIE